MLIYFSVFKIIADYLCLFLIYKDIYMYLFVNVVVVNIIVKESNGNCDN